MSIYVGIDTSNYKTSLAATDHDGIILFNSSEYLDVPKGERGLRQQDCFFKHSAKLPELTEVLFKDIDASEIAAIGVSDKPRRQEGSYMPCFMAGVSAAKYISSSLGIPLYTFSHQEGHAAAVLPKDLNEECIFMHLSGGTSEYLLCKPDSHAYSMEIVGGTKDISFGQLLDRFGVELGFPFPSGMYIDELASSYDTDDKLIGLMTNIKLEDGYFNLSGPETRLMNFARDYVQKCGKIEKSDDLSHTDAELRSASYEILDTISDLLLKSASCLSEKHSLTNVYIAGGVASSRCVRKMIEAKNESLDIDIHFGDPALSGDNAVGTAFLTLRKHEANK